MTDLSITIQQFIDLIPKYVLDIAEKLQENGFQAYLVGGSIRDVLLGKNPADYDIATDAYPEQIEKIFTKSIPTGAKFGTMTVVTQDEKGESFDVEVTTFRSEEDYIGGRWPAKVTFTKTISEDLARRDFTINAIALDLRHFDEADPSIQQILIDPYSGVEDLERKLIRAVRDPLERFTEDGLRAVRACRLASQLEFEIEKDTYETIKKTLHITKQVSVERFRDELQKLLFQSPKPSKGLILMKEAGILELFIPELLENVGVNQPEFHVDDVFTHLMKCVDIAEDSVKLAALFHDIGKARSISYDENGQAHFYGHDKVGAEMTAEIMRRLKFPNSEIDRVVRLIRWHMFYYPSADWRKGLKGDQRLETACLPTRQGDWNKKMRIDEQSFPQPESNIAEHDSFTYLTDEDIDVRLMSEKGTKTQGGWTNGAVRKLMIKVGGDEAIDDLMKLRIADATSNPRCPFNPKEIDALSDRIAAVRAEDSAAKVTDLDINGNELMETFKLEPGPILKEILNHLLDVVMEEPFKNKKETLIEITREYLMSKEDI